LGPGVVAGAFFLSNYNTHQHRLRRAGGGAILKVQECLGTHRGHLEVASWPRDHAFIPMGSKCRQPISAIHFVETEFGGLINPSIAAVGFPGI
jgi:hypothetical protein